MHLESIQLFVMCTDMDTGQLTDEKWFVTILNHHDLCGYDNESIVRVESLFMTRTSAWFVTSHLGESWFVTILLEFVVTCRVVGCSRARKA